MNHDAAATIRSEMLKDRQSHSSSEKLFDSLGGVTLIPSALLFSYDDATYTISNNAFSLASLENAHA